MNSNQIKGAVKDVAGKVRRKAGEVVGSTEQQIKGAAEQIAGKTQKALGDAQEAGKDMGKRQSR
jgi:uncharacterized protein YjbJ (UPF0337 family)